MEDSSLFGFMELSDEVISETHLPWCLSLNLTYSQEGGGGEARSILNSLLI